MAGVRYASFANGRQVYKRRMEKGDGNRSWPEARASMPAETYLKNGRGWQIILKTLDKNFHGENYIWENRSQF